LHQFIDENFFTSLKDLLEIFNSFYKELANIFKCLLSHKKLVFRKLKIRLTESAVTSILEDVERFTDDEKLAYLGTRREILEQAMLDSEHLNFARFDIDFLISEWIELTRTLQRRDELWFEGSLLHRI
jgi:hypothetical protein